MEVLDIRTYGKQVSSLNCWLHEHIVCTNNIDLCDSDSLRATEHGGDLNITDDSVFNNSLSAERIISPPVENCEGTKMSTNSAHIWSYDNMASVSKNTDTAVETAKIPDSTNTISAHCVPSKKTIVNTSEPPSGNQTPKEFVNAHLCTDQDELTPAAHALANPSITPTLDPTDTTGVQIHEMKDDYDQQELTEGSCKLSNNTTVQEANKHFIEPLWEVKDMSTACPSKEEPENTDQPMCYSSDKQDESLTAYEARESSFRFDNPQASVIDVPAEESNDATRESEKHLANAPYHEPSPLNRCLVHNSDIPDSNPDEELISLHHDVTLQASAQNPNECPHIGTQETRIVVYQHASALNHFAGSNSRQIAEHQSSGVGIHDGLTVREDVIENEVKDDLPSSALALVDQNHHNIFNNTEDDNHLSVIREPDTMQTCNDIIIAGNDDISMNEDKNKTMPHVYINNDRKDTVVLSEAITCGISSSNIHQEIRLPIDNGAHGMPPDELELAASMGSDFQSNAGLNDLNFSEEAYEDNSASHNPSDSDESVALEGSVPYKDLYAQLPSKSLAISSPTCIRENTALQTDHEITIMSDIIAKANAISEEIIQELSAKLNKSTENDMSNDVPECGNKKESEEANLPLTQGSASSSDVLGDQNLANSESELSPDAGSPKLHHRTLMNCEASLQSLSGAEVENHGRQSEVTFINSEFPQTHNAIPSNEIPVCKDSMNHSVSFSEVIASDVIEKKSCKPHVGHYVSTTTMSFTERLTKRYSNLIKPPQSQIAPEVSPPNTYDATDGSDYPPEQIHTPVESSDTLVSNSKSIEAPRTKATEDALDASTRNRTYIREQDTGNSNLNQMHDSETGSGVAHSQSPENLTTANNNSFQERLLAHIRNEINSNRRSGKFDNWNIDFTNDRSTTVKQQFELSQQNA